MHIRSMILATVSAVALMSFSTGAFAACITKTIGGDLLPTPIACEAPQSAVGGGHPWTAAQANAYFHPAPPVVVAPTDPVTPVDPVEPAGPTPGVHPDHPEGGGYEVTFVGTVYEGFPAGTYTQIFAPAIPQYDFPGGVIDAVVRPDGTATVWVISYGL